MTSSKLIEQLTLEHHEELAKAINEYILTEVLKLKPVSNVTEKPWQKDYEEFYGEQQID